MVWYSVFCLLSFFFGLNGIYMQKRTLIVYVLFITNI